MYLTVFLRTSFVCCVVILISCSGKKQPTLLPYYNTPEFTPEFFASAKDAEKKISHTIGSFSMTDQNGLPITQKTIDGKIHVANFIFTNCASICPVMTANMKPVQTAFQNNSDVVILSYSVMPWIDNVSKLKAFANNYDIHAPNWHLLTGDKTEIYTLARRSYFAEEDLGFTKDSSDFLHTEHILLIDRTKRIRGIYNGTLQLDIEQMIKDISTLLKEDSKNSK